MFAPSLQPGLVVFVNTVFHSTPYLGKLALNDVEKSFASFC